MFVLRYKILRRWRDYFRGYKPRPAPIPDDPQEDPYTEIPGPTPPDPNTVLLSYAGTAIPASVLDDNSDKYLINPDSGDDGDRGLVILIPWQFIGWVEYSEILTSKIAYALTNSTRNYPLDNSPAYPNGARVHLRNKHSGRDIGAGTLRVRCKDGSWWSWTGSFAVRTGDWILVPEGPAPLTETVMGCANAHAEEINDLVHTDHVIQIPESWQIFQALLFTFPLEGATLLKRARVEGPDRNILLFEIPEICRNYSSLIFQAQSCFSHVTYEIVFDPRVAFSGPSDHLVIYCPIHMFPSHTHDQAEFQQEDKGKWKRVRI